MKGVLRNIVTDPHLFLCMPVLLLQVVQFILDVVFLHPQVLQVLQEPLVHVVVIAGRLIIYYRQAPNHWALHLRYLLYLKSVWIGYRSSKCRMKIKLMSRGWIRVAKDGRVSG